MKKQEHSKQYKITFAILLAVFALMVLGILAGCQRAPYYRNEVNLPFPVDSLTRLTGQNLSSYLGRPTSEFDCHKSWLIYVNGQRYLIVQDPEKIEIIK